MSVIDLDKRKVQSLIIMEIGCGQIVKLFVKHDPDFKNSDNNLNTTSVIC